MAAECAHGIAAWSSPAWLVLAGSWLDERLAEAGLRRTGAVRQPHLLPWSTVLCAPTTGGRVWLKAEGPSQAFEVGLYGLLCAVAPDDVLTPIAVDADRAWLLLPDGGEPLRTRLAGDALAVAVAAAMPRYAALQRAHAPHVNHLLALGVADMRAAAMPGRMDEALVAARAYVEAYGGEHDRQACERAAAMRAQVAAWAERLAGAPGAPTIDHNDLHARNILTRGDGDATFFDWGDSVVAHPFASVLVTLSFLRSHILECEPGDPRLLRVRDAYLGAFADLAPHTELVETLELACRLAKIARALTWERVAQALDPQDVEDRWRRTPLECLMSLTAASYLDP